MVETFERFQKATGLINLMEEDVQVNTPMCSTNNHIYTVDREIFAFFFLHVINFRVFNFRHRRKRGKLNVRKLHVPFARAKFSRVKFSPLREWRKFFNGEHFPIYGSTLFKIQERKADRRSKEIEQRKESQNTHIIQGRTRDLTALTLNYLATSMALKNVYLSI